MESFLQSFLEMLLLVSADAGDFENLGGFLRKSFAGFALGDVGLPIGVGKSEGAQRGCPRGGGLVTQVDDGFRLVVIERSQLAEIEGNYDVGELQGAALVVEDHDVDGAGENSAHRFELPGGGRLGDD